jgi:hypothetical protein
MIFGRVLFPSPCDGVLDGTPGGWTLFPKAVRDGRCLLPDRDHSLPSRKRKRGAGVRLASARLGTVDTQSAE